MMLLFNEAADLIFALEPGDTVTSTAPLAALADSIPSVTTASIAIAIIAAHKNNLLFNMILSSVNFSPPSYILDHYIIYNTS
jgi:hypothetical protein